MFSARIARDATHPNALKRIEQDVEWVIQSGMTSISVYGDMLPETQIELRSKGYEITDDSSSYQGKRIPFFKISWHRA